MIVLGLMLVIAVLALFYRKTLGSFDEMWIMILGPEVGLNKTANEIASSMPLKIFRSQRWIMQLAANISPATFQTPPVEEHHRQRTRNRFTRQARYLLNLAFVMQFHAEGHVRCTDLYKKQSSKPTFWHSLHPGISASRHPPKNCATP